MPAWDGPLPQTTAEALAAFALEALKENSKEINFLDSLLAAWDNVLALCSYHVEQGAIDKDFIIVQ